MQGKSIKAIPLIEKYVSKAIKVYGEGHSNIVGSMKDLGNAYKNIGNY